MKTYKEFIAEERALTSNTTSGVAEPDAKPLFKVSRIAGCDAIEVDPDTYNRCKFGKEKYKRWDSVIEDEALRDFIKKKFYRSDKLMITNSATGASVMFKK